MLPCNGKRSLRLALPYALPGEYRRNSTGGKQLIFRASTEEVEAVVRPQNHFQGFPSITLPVIFWIKFHDPFNTVFVSETTKI